MVKRMVIMLVVLAIVFGGLYFMHVSSGLFVQKLVAQMKNPLNTVSATPAVESDWTRQLEAVGSLRAVRGAELSLQVAGIVDQIAFKSGQDVKQGDLLLRLDARQDQAQLEALRAAARLAEVTYTRDQKQHAVQAVSQQTLDADKAALAQARANVAAQQAAVDHKTLRAPFSGRLGLRLVDLGQYLQAGTSVVTLQALQPIFVDFFLPQQALSDLHAGQPVIAATDSWPTTQFPGTIIAISPLVDTSTRNLQVRAELANADARLLPGMYATVDITTGQPTAYITLPQTAIVHHPYGDTVFLLHARDMQQAGPKTAAGNSAKPDDGEREWTAQQQFVTTGATRGDQIQVLKGVKAGDLVVTAGQLKLHNGSRVRVDNSIVPTNDAHPTPQEH